MFGLRLCVSLAIVFAAAQSATGQTMRDTDILVMFNPGTIALPAGEVSATIDRAGLSPDVISVLQNTGALLVSRAAPEAASAASFDIGPDGSPVPVLDLSRLYRISFASGSDLDRDWDQARVSFMRRGFREWSSSRPSQTIPISVFSGD
jgi:hypothetical protein